MKCFNCGKEIPASAKACEHCEAMVEAGPTEKEVEVVLEIMQQMPPEMLESLEAMIGQSETADQFVNQLFVGDCPKCGSEDTGDCENDPEIDCVLVGRCFQCGQLWRTECDKLLEQSLPECSCWDDGE